MSSKDFIVKNSLQISGGDLVFSKDSDGDLEVKNSSGTRKTLKVDKIELGTGDDVLVIERDSNGKFKQSGKNRSNNATSTTTPEFLIDEDNMSSNSATKVPSQQSVKAYVDSQVATADALSELSGDSDDITEGSSNLFHTTERVQDVVGAQLVTNGSHSGVSVAYDDAGDGAIDITVGTLNQDTTGNAATATALETARTIHGVSFDGTANIDLTEVVQDTVGAQVVTNGSHTNITASYDDSGDGAIDLSISDAVIQGKITAGTGVSVSSGQVSIGQAVATSDSPTFAGLTLTGDQTSTGHILPSADNTYDLGSSTKMWRDVYIGPGSLYVNGQKVVEDSSGTIVVSADDNQNVSVQTGGSGDVELDPTGTGSIQLKGPVEIQAGNNVTSSDGNAISFSNSIDVDAIESRSADTNLVLSANGTGVVAVSDSLTVSGDLTVSGTTTTVNSETINLADNVIALNSNFTSGSPTEDSGISITRGGSSAKTLLWDETNDKWTVGSETFVAGTFEGALTGNVTGNVSGSSGSTTGNAATATALATGRTINGVTFDGTANITTLTAGTGVSVSGTAVSIGQAVSTSSNVEFTQITTNYANNSGGVARNVYQSTSAPTSSDGAVGDLWILYS